MRHPTTYTRQRRARHALYILVAARMTTTPEIPSTRVTQTPGGNTTLKVMGSDMAARSPAAALVPTAKTLEKTKLELITGLATCGDEGERRRGHLKEGEPMRVWPLCAGVGWNTVCVCACVCDEETISCCLSLPSISSHSLPSGIMLAHLAFFPKLPLHPRPVSFHFLGRGRGSVQRLPVISLSHSL